jgi:hypothetical protein
MDDSKTLDNDLMGAFCQVFEAGAFLETLIDLADSLQQLPISRSKHRLLPSSASPNWNGFQETATILPSATVSIYIPNISCVLQHQGAR